MAILSPRLGLLIGAGFSYEAGMPLVYDLTAEIKNWLTPKKFREINEGWRKQGGGYSDAIVDDFISVLQRDSLHYESILGYIEVQFTRAKAKAKAEAEAQAYHRLYSWLVNLVYHILYYRQVNNDAFFDRQLDFYSGITSLTSTESPLWVFSLNHDLLVEAISKKFSIPLYSGFSQRIVSLPRRNHQGRKIGDIRAEILTKKELEEQAMYFPNPLVPGIYLLKIHGALDVFVYNDDYDLIKLLPDDDKLESVFSTLKMANEELFYPTQEIHSMGRVHVSNEIAYADDQGEMQFLRRTLLAGAYKFDQYKHQVLPKSLLKHFRTNINFVTKLTCIGYGFGDIHINQVIRDWLAFSSDRHIEIVSPEIKGVPGFLLHLSPQVTIVKNTATNYLDTAAGIERTYSEQLIKRLSTRVRQLGPKAKALISQFSADELERVKGGVLAKLKDLPTKDGKPDFDLIGDPEGTAVKWANDLYGSTDQRLERMLNTLDEADRQSS